MAEVMLFLCGDVMTGRGVDQIFPHPGDPRLWESYVQDARTYVELAEAVNGTFPRPVEYAWPWGEALQTLDEVKPDVRVINLETSVTRSDDVAYGKAVHYRMTPENIACLTVARPDVCVLANNHVLDFGHRGLSDTIEALSAAGIAVGGAGRDASEARRPTTIEVDGRGRVVVLSCGTQSSGIPPEWAASEHGAGVHLLPDLSDSTADEMAERVRLAKRPGDLVVVSIHWGSNWGYEVPADHIRFAHRVIDGGVDLIHGHSSHHPRPIEVYRGRLILYGCGDFIDDYEGIGGHEDYRDDLRLLYFATLEKATGGLVRLRMVSMQARQMRLHHTTTDDAEYVRSVLDQTSRCFGSRVDPTPDGALELRHHYQA